MALSQMIARYDELAVGSDHPTLPDTISRGFLIDHDKYGSHKRMTYADILANGDGSQLTTGMVVVMTTTTLQYSRTTIQADPRQVLVVQDTIVNGGQGYVAHMGYVANVMVQGTVDVNDGLRTSTTSGRAESAGASPSAGVFGIALSANASGAGTVKALLFGVTLPGLRTAQGDFTVLAASVADVTIAHGMNAIPKVVLFTAARQFEGENGGQQGAFGAASVVGDGTTTVQGVQYNDNAASNTWGVDRRFSAYTYFHSAGPHRKGGYVKTLDVTNIVVGNRIVSGTAIDIVVKWWALFG